MFFVWMEIGFRLGQSESGRAYRYRTWAVRVVCRANELRILFSNVKYRRGRCHECEGKNNAHGSNPRAHIMCISICTRLINKNKNLGKKFLLLEVGRIVYNPCAQPFLPSFVRSCRVCSIPPCPSSTVSYTFLDFTAQQWICVCV